jgi:hypothetical protein
MDGRVGFIDIQFQPPHSAHAIVIMGAVAVAVLGQEVATPVAVGRMNTGQTPTSTTAPAAIVTSFASPTMKAARPNGFG